MARARFLTRVQPRQEGVEVANPREAVIRPAIGNRCGDGMPQVKLISSRSPSSLLRIIIRVTDSPQGVTGTWANARERWIEQWFGFAPDFIITLDAIYSHPCGNAEFMALVVYGLYHAAQETAFGAPKFTSRPIVTGAAEYVSVVRRYGADAGGIQPAA
ncbi:hypothetical protein CN128_16880 [Sinorhizobium meliloti]|uniref:putative metallopeptidase n=2 Tax=Rhizobium meliloti TaxID=382 RepID=UPI0001E4C804|nr:putative metallopeptidase [Sinorhizobium meliloti]AEG08339.1 hypothetical protein SinmeB_4038 [Sinorhizobium meliloti BL225C]MCO6425592.1 hypothetical protein [Sinorhizobium meliloti]MDE4549331.1 hypothetical protein [Sinorhizobium meliloti]MDE4569620.1 hypothetical protein [Sinorhizobium meliloti]MDW9460851.1 hypothetical protein [Sinorhizobium meliloti]